jgi:hypothetical protein
MTVHVERFLHIWNFLRHQEDIGYVVTTDVRDVVFQKNPVVFLDSVKSFYERAFVVGSECIRYKDEPWGRQNLLETFGPAFFDLYKDRIIYNVGVLGGTFEQVRDMCIMIWQMAQNRPIPICDQAVFNFLLWQEPWASVTNFSPMGSCGGMDPPRVGWAAHCGTVADPQKLPAFEPHLTEKCDVDITRNGIVYVFRDLGPPFDPVVLHQWDRVPEFRDKVMKRYG